MLLSFLVPNITNLENKRGYDDIQGGQENFIAGTAMDQCVLTDIGACSGRS